MRVPCYSFLFRYKNRVSTHCFGAERHALKEQQRTRYRPREGNVELTAILFLLDRSNPCFTRQSFVD